LVVEIDEISERFFEDLNNPAQSYPRLQPALPHQGHAFGKSKTKSRRQQCCGEFLEVPRRYAAPPSNPASWQIPMRSHAPG